MDAGARHFASARRTATLATLGPDGWPRLVPICFVLDVHDGAMGHPAASAEDPGVVLYSPLDEKPKRSRDVRDLARVRDILERPGVSVLFDRWSEDWQRLAWLRARGTARLLEPGGAQQAEHAAAVGQLREKYPQYGSQQIDGLPLIAVSIDKISRWGDLSEPT